MTIKLQHLRSNVLGKLPQASHLDVGQIAVNFNADDPFLSIKDATGKVRRLGGATIGNTAPKAPVDGQLWVNTNTNPPQLRMWDAANTKYISVAPAIPSASEAHKGIAEIATQAEVTTGTDGTRIVTPKTLKAAINAIPDATEAVKGIAQIATQGEVTTGTDDTKIVTPLKLKTAINAIPSASEAHKGLAEIATQTEVNAGTDDARIVTPKKLKAAIHAIHPATETVKGIAEIATQAEVTAGTDGTRIVTPKTLKAAIHAIPSASETVKGVAEIATQAEVTTGTDNTRIVTPQKLKVAIDAIPSTPSASETVKGIAEIATQAEVTTGTDDTRIVSPKKLKAAIHAIPSASETHKGLAEIATQAEVNAGTDATRIVTPKTAKAAFVNASGDTMTGNLTVPSLNTGQLAGFRNVLINGAVTINQRGKTYAAVAVGEYWADRWKKVSGGMVQIIESGNYKPSTQYTLSGKGVPTQHITSPASGNWTIPHVPSTATHIQLEPGPIVTPFEYRPIGVELALCQRYYTKINISTMVLSYTTKGFYQGNVRFHTQFRANPSLGVTTPVKIQPSGAHKTVHANNASVNGCRIVTIDGDVPVSYHSIFIEGHAECTADAEL